jgi:hypothetical protein
VGGVSCDESLRPAHGWNGECRRDALPDEGLLGDEPPRIRQEGAPLVNLLAGWKPGRALSPVRGGFSGERGEFFGEDVDDGRTVKVRFVWEQLGPDRARWEQAFSADGSLWESNWLMEFTRADVSPQGS